MQQRCGLVWPLGSFSAIGSHSCVLVLVVGNKKVIFLHFLVFYTSLGFGDKYPHQGSWSFIFPVFCYQIVVQITFMIQFRKMFII